MPQLDSRPTNQCEMRIFRIVAEGVGDVDAHHLHKIRSWRGGYYSMTSVTDKLIHTKANCLSFPSVTT